jgi:hypothetical protein
VLTQSRRVSDRKTERAEERKGPRLGQAEAEINYPRGACREIQQPTDRVDRDLSLGISQTITIQTGVFKQEERV